MIARAVIVAIAVVVIGWLVVIERDHRSLTQANALSGRLSLEDKRACAQSPTSRAACADFRTAVRDARRARRLNPDTEPDLVLGLLKGAADWRSQAAAVQAVLRKEPENVAVWNTYALVVAGHDQREFRRASATLHRLDPLDWPNG